MTYEELEKMYRTFVLEAKELRKQIATFFAEKNDAMIARSAFEKFVQRENMVLENQAKEEKEKIDEDTLRFYREFSLDDVYYQGKYREPKSLEVRGTAKLPTKKEFEALSDDEKTKCYAEIVKDLAILSARNANLVNREKNSERSSVGGQFAYGKKDEYMATFLARAYIYNQLVPENEQIYFGFDYEEITGTAISKKDNSTYHYTNCPMTLNASIPGYTRLSLHFGRQVIPVFKRANEIIELERAVLSGKRLRTFPIDSRELRIFEEDKKNAQRKHIDFKPKYPNQTTKKLASLMPYELKQYVINLGLISRDDYNGAEIYTETLKEMAIKNGDFNDIGFEDFLNYVSPDLNKREIMYLAERAGFGKGVLKKAQDIVKKRGNSTKNPNKKREDYLKKRLEDAQTEKEKLEVLRSLGIGHFKIMELENPDMIWSEKVNEFMEQVKDKVDKETLAKWFSATVEDVLEKDANDADKIAEVLPYVTESNIKTLNQVFNGYTDGDIYDVLVEGNGKFRENSFRRLVLFVDEKNRERICNIAEELSENSKTEEPTTEMYEQMLEIALQSKPEEIDDVEMLEQFLLDRNKKRGE